MVTKALWLLLGMTLGELLVQHNVFPHSGFECVRVTGYVDAK
jgi:hypothetical protein